jgi:hypothetical protein
MHANQEGHFTPSRTRVIQKNLLLTFAPTAVVVGGARRRRVPGERSLARGNFLALILSLYGVTHTHTSWYMHIVHNQRILRRGAVRASERLSGAKSERAQRVACVAPIVSTYTRKEKGLQRKWEVPWRAARRIAGRV